MDSNNVAAMTVVIRLAIKMAIKKATRMVGIRPRMATIAFQLQDYVRL